MNTCFFMNGKKLLKQLVFSFIILITIFSLMKTQQQPVFARPLLDPIATVTTNIPDTVFIGQNFTFTASFDNTGTDTGYGPFIDFNFPGERCRW